MFRRNIEKQLLEWKAKSNRKPLIIRGARQVGKTTLIKLFGAAFKQFIYLNLEIQDNRRIFTESSDIHTLVNLIFIKENKNINEKDTLLFIDEIQNEPVAVQHLRYFYEKYPRIFVIAAGSTLESLLSKKISFPVGRVEFLLLRPFSFDEYLLASKQNNLHKLLQQIPVPDFTHQKLEEEFKKYSIIGGMPEIIKEYLETGQIAGLNSLYEGLLISYMEDAEKYARNDSIQKVFRHVIKSCFSKFNERIVFQGFGNSVYKSREVSETFDLLQNAFLLNLIYPATDAKLPITPNKRKSPKLQMLDTGLLAYFTDSQRDLLLTKEIVEVYKGKIAEHIVGQELLATSYSPLYHLNFWARDKNQSAAEVDFVISDRGKMIPIEVKLGKSGRLRSLHAFIDLCNHQTAIRVCMNAFSVEKVSTIKGKPYFLINLPFYLVHKVHDYLDWVNEKYRITRLT
ncbi:MAG: ATP-binding protein [Bacteroidetes bacterium]|nr:ATP-binding protein [Bacteroidota bacterium]